MTDSGENLAAFYKGRDRQFATLLAITRTELKVDELLRLQRRQELAQQSSSGWPALAKAFGQAIGRSMLPYLTAQAVAALAWLGGFVVVAFKAYSRGWLGF